MFVYNPSILSVWSCLAKLVFTSDATRRNFSESRRARVLGLSSRAMPSFVNIVVELFRAGQGKCRAYSSLLKSLRILEKAIHKFLFYDIQCCPFRSSQNWTKNHVNWTFFEHIFYEKLDVSDLPKYFHYWSQTSFLTKARNIIELGKFSSRAELTKSSAQLVTEPSQARKITNKQDTL